MNKIINDISLYGIVPVIKIECLEDAPYLAKALCEGGLPVAEVTFRTACAKEAIIAMKKACPQMIIGAGTVLNPAQVNSAIEAGSEFIVSPGLNPKTVQYCLDKDIPILPGCANPSDMEQAIELGLDVVKFFPAQANGGLPAIKAMSAPYCNLKFFLEKQGYTFDMQTARYNHKNKIEFIYFNELISGCKCHLCLEG